ncbi:type II toxin-antitoxin system PemI/MazE family antitoxin [Companilactobacillus insicii]|uniref:type II toxin-antitoxin system PemI/MazE family antitoxin n=1 Tax=Companilactobacillus insicii TaxID=1732567 RepID=UPI000F790554|nr:antitoxin of toxin-antitoxin stability system [Companilactobacillus insicii]
MSVKIRKVGNSNTLTVPNNIKPMAKEYDVFQGRDGVIVFSPKKKNPFHDEEFIKNHDWTQDEEFGGPLIGKEKLDNE